MERKISMQVFTYNGAPEVFEGMDMVPGKEYAIEEVGYADGSKRYNGVVGVLAAIVGIRKPLRNCYWVHIYGDGDSHLCAYSSKDIFNQIWQLKKLA